MNRRSAFTLVEILIVCAILGIVTATTAAMLFGGFRVWRNLEGEPLRDHWMLMTSRRIEKDLRGVRRFGSLPFEGDYESFSFAGVVDESETPGSGRLARIGYYRDDRTDNLCRSVQPYPEALRKRLRAECDPFLSEVKRLKLAYLGRKPSGEVEWLSHWASVEPPLAVRFDLETEGESRQRTLKRALLVAIPSAKLPKPEPSS